MLDKPAWKWYTVVIKRKEVHEMYELIVVVAVVVYGALLWWSMR